ncbi:hypothetical protein TNCV_3237431 [Trichonephila clavipes]|nr:hypothetical protein TNCV_3237431 [Trichonephila clavipes]
MNIALKKQVRLCSVRLLSHNHLDDSLILNISRLEASQSQAVVNGWLQVARKWSPVYGINSKQVVLSPGSSVKFATESRHLHRTTSWL